MERHPAVIRTASGRPIRVGIIGLSATGGFAAGAHVPALRAVEGYELRGAAASSPESAIAATAKHEVPIAFDSAPALVTSDEIDLVVVTVKVPFHAELVSAALAAGKNVLCEWPLGNGSPETAALAQQAKAAGIHGTVGLQAQSAPSVRYLRDLIADGYVGEVLSTTLVGSGLSWGAEVPSAALRHTIDASNGVTMLVIPMGHTFDALQFVLGELTEFKSTVTTRRPEVLDAESGQMLPMTVSDQVAVSGYLTGGAVVAAHYRAGMSRATNLRWEINGTDGDIVITAPTGHLQLADLDIRAVRGDGTTLEPVVVPDSYQKVPSLLGHSARVTNVANAYAQLRDDLREGTSVVPTFEYAVGRHRQLDAIETAGRT